MIKKLWPARTAKQPDGPVCDLDAIIAEPVNFRFKGKIHTINPVTTEAFLKFTSAHAALMRSAADQETPITAHELANKYFQVLSPLCSTVTVEMILEMQQAQIAALFQLVIDVVTGQVDDGEDKKKRTKIRDLYASALRSSSPSAPSDGDGPAKPH